MKHFLIILCFLISIYLYLTYHQYEITQKTNLSYYKFDKNLSSTNNTNDTQVIFKEICSDNNIEYTNILDNANIVFFSLLTDYIQVSYKLLKLNNIKYIYSIKSIDLLASKSVLYEFLHNTLSKQELDNTVPNTFLIQNDTELNIFKKQFDPNKLYILKKNVQRQKGCTITNNLQYILKNSNEYVVCQELLLNPYLIHGYKINIRVYLLVSIQKTPKLYIYNDGFIYYAPSKFDSSSDKDDIHITTGYIDRKMYDDKPMTLQEFMSTLNIKEANTLKFNIIRIFKNVKKSYHNHLKKYDSSDKINFVICGADLAIDNNLNCKLMEINKGPDLTYKDTRDKIVKYNLVNDAYKVIGLTDGFSENYIHIS